MNEADLREHLDWGYRKSETLAGAKSSLGGLPYFRNFFRSIDESDHAAAGSILAAWALEDDEKRFVTLAIIDEFRLTSALPVLRVLAERCEHADGPSAPYDWAKVNRVIGHLVATP